MNKYKTYQPLSLFNKKIRSSALVFEGGNFVIRLSGTDAYCAKCFPESHVLVLSKKKKMAKRRRHHRVTEMLNEFKLTTFRMHELNSVVRF